MIFDKVRWRSWLPPILRLTYKIIYYERCCD
nr:MAG TPA: hypothetical protein [Caudoviricetes sp.]